MKRKVEVHSSKNLLTSENKVTKFSWKIFISRNAFLGILFSAVAKALAFTFRKTFVQLARLTFIDQTQI